ncbi:hypothetical protein DL1_08610 [Thioclava dalianensis]|uniref:Uncharacterized protein n=1 Tax=Thioclava dalianensis TaxID=1185766 RepID=A0A074TFA8_9RHOB|nr:hypothetical protein [Thioclava dalianensis]KEP68825.1 hypothetical protein DL1_08610 [Thioclava dalianensis]SFN49554.1 hypothetical protein SAMN05216224_10666 [Thioclava dalianensis]
MQTNKHSIDGATDLNGLTEIYEAYCAAYGLELISADEQLLRQIEARNHERADWLRAFCARWERIESDQVEGAQ